MNTAATQAIQPAPPEVFTLWPPQTPEGKDSRATLTHFPAPDAPDKAPNKAGVLVIPGGGYGVVVVGHEGTDIVAWLHGRGLDAWMLRYSTASDHATPLLDLPLREAQRAVAIIRERFAPPLLGAWGFSAGGHLCATLATSNWEPPTRGVDFHILAYPVITMGPKTHEGSRNNLLGAGPTAAQVEAFSAERRVSLSTSPCFVFHTVDDPAVPVENALLYIEALRAHGVACEAHLYEHGPHGVGLAPSDAVLSTWGARLEDWLKRRGAIGA